MDVDVFEYLDIILRLDGADRDVLFREAVKRHREASSEQSGQAHPDPPVTTSEKL